MGETHRHLWNVTPAVEQPSGVIETWRSCECGKVEIERLRRIDRPVRSWKWLWRKRTESRLVRTREALN